MVKSWNDVGSEDRGGTMITHLTGGYPLFVHPLYKKCKLQSIGYVSPTWDWGTPSWE